MVAFKDMRKELRNRNYSLSQLSDFGKGQRSHHHFLTCRKLHVFTLLSFYWFRSKRIRIILEIWEIACGTYKTKFTEDTTLVELCCWRA